MTPVLQHSVHQLQSATVVWHSAQRLLQRLHTPPPHKVNNCDISSIYDVSCSQTNTVDSYLQLGFLVQLTHQSYLPYTAASKPLTSAAATVVNTRDEHTKQRLTLLVTTLQISARFASCDSCFCSLPRGL